MLGKRLGRRLKIILLHVVCEKDGTALIVNDLKVPSNFVELPLKGPRRAVLATFVIVESSL